MSSHPHAMHMWQLQAFIFWSLTEFCWHDQEKLGQFGHNVRNVRLVNTVTVSFKTFMGYMTEMSQKKSLVLLAAA